MKRRIKFFSSLTTLKKHTRRKYSSLALSSLGYSFFMPRRASLTRLHRRCFLTGLSRSHVRFFALSRHSFRSLALAGKLFGVRKSSF